MSVVFFLRECYICIMISWFVLALACVAAISEYTAVHLLCLEDTGKPVRKFTNTFCPWRISLKIFFCSGRRLSSSNCSVIVYCKHSLPTSNCHAHVRIGPIVRCVKKHVKTANEKCSHILYIVSEQLCWISEWAFVALIRRQTILMV